MVKRPSIRPDGAPKLGETYRDWRDFTARVARPWVENDGADPKADHWYHTLMLERDPYYLAVALVFADNRIRQLEGDIAEFVRRHPEMRGHDTAFGVLAEVQDRTGAEDDGS